MISLIQLSLSDVTPAWLLYLGILFIVTVLFAPTGIAGLLERHLPLLRAGLFHRLIPSYLLSGAAGLVFCAGAVALLEMNYHVTLNSHEGPLLQLFGDGGYHAARGLVWPRSPQSRFFCSARPGRMSPTH